MGSDSAMELGELAPRTDEAGAFGSSYGGLAARKEARRVQRQESERSATSSYTGREDVARAAALLPPPSSAIEPEQQPGVLTFQGPGGGAAPNADGDSAPPLDDLDEVVVPTNRNVAGMRLSDGRPSSTYSFEDQGESAF